MHSTFTRKAAVWQSVNATMGDTEVTDGEESLNDTERSAWRIRNAPRGYEPVDHVREKDIYANAAEPDPASRLTIVWPRDTEIERQSR